jgi:hypothetical protein
LRMVDWLLPVDKSSICNIEINRQTSERSCRNRMRRQAMSLSGSDTNWIGLDSSLGHLGPRTRDNSRCLPPPPRRRLTGRCCRLTTRRPGEKALARAGRRGLSTSWASDIAPMTAVISSGSARRTQGGGCLSTERDRIGKVTVRPVAVVGGTS